MLEILTLYRVKFFKILIHKNSVRTSQETHYGLLFIVNPYVFSFNFPLYLQSVPIHTANVVK
jgi:hypothetical protein